MAAANPKPDARAAIFSAVIRPHRSLSQGGFVIVMALIGGLSFIAGVVFFLLGAWPVVGFLGLDVALVWWAFRANYRAARAREIIRISPTEIRIRHVTHRGAVAEWSFNPCWSRLLVEHNEENGISALALTSHGQRVGIAGWLSPIERADFARALSGALAAARLGHSPREPV